MIQKQTPLWTTQALIAAMAATPRGALPESVSGLSIDSRTVAAGEAYFAITGDVHDGHAFVAAALAAGAGLAVVAHEKLADCPAGAPLLVVPDVLDALRALALAARARTQARVVGVTGSVGKTSTKEAMRIAFAREGATHASVASFNNHWGVPLSLARCPEETRYAVFEMGMNHAGEIAPLTQMVRPHVAIITTIAPVHLEFFDSLAGIADAKAEIFSGVVDGGAAVLNRDNDFFSHLAEAAKAAGVARVVSFGEHPDADARLVSCALHAECSTVQASILGTDVTYKIGAPGRHHVLNSLSVLAAAVLAGADLALAALALAELQPPSGRGRRYELALRGGGTATLIDESYNANPASMRAALALLGQADTGLRGRRIAVLGDMLELGAQSGQLHADLTGPLVDNAVDVVFCAGPLMRALWDALPSERRGGYADTAAGLEADLVSAVRAGDTIMVKGSLGSRMGPLVQSLQQAYPTLTARDVVGTPVAGKTARGKTPAGAGRG